MVSFESVSRLQGNVNVNVMSHVGTGREDIRHGTAPISTKNTCFNQKKKPVYTTCFRLWLHVNLLELPFSLMCYIELQRLSDCSKSITLHDYNIMMLLKIINMYKCYRELQRGFFFLMPFVVFRSGSALTRQLPLKYVQVLIFGIKGFPRPMEPCNLAWAFMLSFNAFKEHPLALIIPLKSTHTPLYWD